MHGSLDVGCAVPIYGSSSSLQPRPLEDVGRPSQVASWRQGQESSWGLLRGADERSGRSPGKPPPGLLHCAFSTHPCGAPSSIPASDDFKMQVAGCLEQTTSAACEREPDHVGPLEQVAVAP